jgi:glycosyltransferase involved in cell wall biosynthesis
MLEAMASGVPPVVTAIAGVPEVVTDHETGVLLEPGNPDEVAQAVIELFDDAELRARLATNAREYITENLTWEQRTERVMEVYSQVVTND